LRVFVDDKFQGKGIGAKAIKLGVNKMLDIYKNIVIITFISENNLTSIKAHLKVGFSYLKKPKMKI
jgi:RimJ/RimL family protein N-acetyltransferase